ncbi:MAG: hypothetical protein AAB426_15000 [Myxococcota bacterium]
MNETRSLEDFLRTVIVRSWQVFVADPLLYILVSLVLVVLGSLTLGILLGPLLVGSIQVVRHRMRGEPAEVGTMFGGMSSFVTAFLTLLIIGVGVTLGMVLFIIPGILVLVITVFAPHEIAYRKAGVIDALRGSYRVASKSLVGVAIVMILLGVLNSIAGSTMIGIILAAPYSLIATVVTYEELSGAR